MTEPALFLGHLATYDATALFLLTLATWLVVRSADQARPLYLLAAPVLVLAVATKYATLLFVPSVIGLAGLAAAPRLGRRALVNSAALGAATVALLLGAAYLAGPDYLTGFKFTTLDRCEGAASDPVAALGRRAVDRGAVPARRGRHGRLRDPAAHRAAASGSRRRQPRAAGAARRADGGQRAARPDRADPHPHRDLAVQARRFRADVRGADRRASGLARIIGDHFRRAQIGIAIWGASLAIGMTSAGNLFDAWPNSTVFMADLARYMQPGGRYLVEADEVPIYYLRDHADAQPRPVHLHVLHRLHDQAGPVPDRGRGLRRRDQGGLLQRSRVQLPDHPGRRRGARADAGRRPGLQPGRRHTQRRRHRPPVHLGQDRLAACWAGADGSTSGWPMSCQTERASPATSSGKTIQVSDSLAVVNCSGLGRRWNSCMLTGQKIGQPPCVSSSPAMCAAQPSATAIASIGTCQERPAAGQVGAGVAGDDRRPDAEEVAVVPADVQRAQRGRVEQRHEQPRGHQVPGERGVPDPGHLRARQLVLAGEVRARGEHRDADDAVGAVPVPARQHRHQPGEPLGEEPERARDRGVRMVDVGQHPRAGAERHPGRQVRVAHVQRRRERGEDERAAQRVIPAHHGAAQLPGSRMNY